MTEDVVYHARARGVNFEDARVRHFMQGWVAASRTLMCPIRISDLAIRRAEVVARAPRRSSGPLPKRQK